MLVDAFTSLEVFVASLGASSVRTESNLKELYDSEKYVDEAVSVLAPFFQTKLAAEAMTKQEIKRWTKNCLNSRSIGSRDVSSNWRVYRYPVTVNRCSMLWPRG